MLKLEGSRPRRWGIHFEISLATECRLSYPGPFVKRKMRTLLPLAVAPPYRGSFLGATCLPTAVARFRQGLRRGRFHPYTPSHGRSTDIHFARHHGGRPGLRRYPRPVQTFFEYLEAGDTIDDFYFPTVTRQQVLVLLETAKGKVLAEVK